MVEDNSSSRKVPWQQLQEYLGMHESKVKSLIDIVDQGRISRSQAESLLPSALLQVHSLLTQILQKNMIAIENDKQQPQDTMVVNPPDEVIKQLQIQIQEVNQQNLVLKAKIEQLLIQNREDIQQLRNNMTEEKNAIIRHYERQIEKLKKDIQHQEIAKKVVAAHETFYQNSTCATNDNEKKAMKALMDQRQLDLSVLLYRGSRDGWNADDFHLRCDNKGATVTLFKIKHGPCIGGFTTAQWTSPSKSSVNNSDSSAILFNLTQNLAFPIVIQDRAIQCKRECGPCFGNSELSAYYEPFNEENQLESYANNSAYGIKRSQQNRNMLTNQFDSKFTITELEVWHVIEAQPVSSQKDFE